MDFNVDLYLDKNNEINKYTGLSRDGWIAVAKKLLSGAMQCVKNYNNPIVIPRSEFKLTYPHAESEGTTLVGKRAQNVLKHLPERCLLQRPCCVSARSLA